MITAQKIIKNLAIAFAIFLIVTIISSILSGLFVLTNILDFKKENKDTNVEMIETAIEEANIQSLYIDVDFTNLIIKNGDMLKVETDNKDIKLNQNNNNFEIKEKGNKLFSKNNEGNLVLYLPENIEFKEVKIVAGASKIDIEDLTTNDLNLELGAGKTRIQNLNVSDKCKIDGGAGKVDIESGIINDLDLDMGVGETNITASLIGKSDIDAGIGSLKIELIGNKQDYTIKTNKGIGTIRVDGNSMSNGQLYGDGKNTIELDGGIGNIVVEFK